eukprot:gene28973-35937_t
MKRMQSILSAQTNTNAEQLSEYHILFECINDFSAVLPLAPVNNAISPDKVTHPESTDANNITSSWRNTLSTANHLFFTKQFQPALQHYLALLKDATQCSDEVNAVEVKEIYSNTAKCYSALGQHQQAAETYLTFAQLNRHTSSSTSSSLHEDRDTSSVIVKAAVIYFRLKMCTESRSAYQLAIDRLEPHMTLHDDADTSIIRSEDDVTTSLHYIARQGSAACLVAQHVGLLTSSVTLVEALHYFELITLLRTKRAYAFYAKGSLYSTVKLSSACVPFQFDASGSPLPLSPSPLRDDLTLERAHDLWRRVATVANRYLHYYRQQSMLALYNAGLCAMHYSNSHAQRALEAAQSVRDEIERQWSEGDSKPTAYYTAIADLSHHLGLVYLRGGKIHYAVQEARHAIWGYHFLDTSSTTLTSSSTITTTSVVPDTSHLTSLQRASIDSTRVRQSVSLLAVALSLCERGEESERVMSYLRGQYVGPIEDGPHEISLLRQMIANKKPKQTAPIVTVSSSMSSSSTSSSSGSNADSGVSNVRVERDEEEEDSSNNFTSS